MTFISPPPSSSPLDAVIGQSWFPDVNPSDVRESLQIDVSVSPSQLRSSLIEAITYVNSALGKWRGEHSGYADLASVPAEQIDGVSIHQHCYLRAVGTKAKANILERTPDADATGKGMSSSTLIDKAAALHSVVDALHRDMHHAINDIYGRARATVELI